MGSIIAVSRKPLDDTPAPGRNRPGQPRIITCRYLNLDGNRCTGEALDPGADILICIRHAGLVLELARSEVTP